MEESEEFYRQLELRRGGGFTIIQELAKSRGSFLNTSARRRFPAGRSRRRARYSWRVLEEFGLGGTECGGSRKGIATICMGPHGTIVVGSQWDCRLVMVPSLGER